MTAVSSLLVFFAGLALGGIFYGGLWLTVRLLPTARNPVLLTLASFWTRIVLVLASFLLLARGNWLNALICLAGFVMGRVAVSRYVSAQEARAKCQ